MNAAGVGELGGVDEKVGQDLPQALRVGEHDDVRRDVDGERHRPPAQQRRHRIAHRLGKSADRDRRELVRELPLFDPRQVEKILYQRQLILNGAAHAAERVRLLRRRRAENAFLV